MDSVYRLPDRGKESQKESILVFGSLFSLLLSHYWFPLPTVSKVLAMSWATWSTPSATWKSRWPGLLTHLTCWTSSWLIYYVCRSLTNMWPRQWFIDPKWYLISQAVLPLLHTTVLAGHPHPCRLLPLSLHPPHHRGLPACYEIRSLNLLSNLPKT